MLSKILLGQRGCLISCITKLNSTLESGFLNVTHSSSSTENLRFDNAAIAELGCNFMSFLWSESNLSERDSNLVGVEESSGLVLVELDASEWSRD